MKTGQMVIKIIGKGIAKHQTHSCKYDSQVKDCYCVCMPDLSKAKKDDEGRWDKPGTDDDGDHNQKLDAVNRGMYPPIDPAKWRAEGNVKPDHFKFTAAPSAHWSGRHSQKSASPPAPSPSSKSDDDDDD
jgi:hypothetical protein